MSNGIVSTLLSILRASSQVLFSFSTSQKLRMTKRLQKSLLCNHNILVMFWRLVSKMKRGSRKRRQELHSVRVTSCQSPIRMFQDEIQDETKGKWFSVINFFLYFFFNLFLKRKILLPCLGSKAPAQSNRPLRSETPQPLPGL